jgi:hypothetical protein
MCTNSTVQGCNLSVQGKNEKLHFLELQDFSGADLAVSIGIANLNFQIISKWQI